MRALSFHPAPTVAVLVLALGAFAVPADAIVVSCGDQINLGGQTMVMENDVLDCDQSPAVTVTGPGTFDMDLHAVSCDDPSDPGVVVDGTKAKLRNGIVSGCYNGVLLEGSGHQVQGMVSRGNTQAGFWNDAPDAKFKNNLAAGNLHGFVNDLPAVNSKYTKNTAAGNRGDGFLNDAPDCQYTANQATGSGDDGFDNDITASGTKYVKNMSLGNGGGSTSDMGFENAADGCTYSGNTSSGNDGDGFENGGSGTRFTKNTASGNGARGFENFADACEFDKNVATANVGDGIDNRSGATDNAYEKNVALGNGGVDLNDESPGNTCDNNTWVANTFGSADPAGCVQ